VFDSQATIYIIPKQLASFDRTGCGLALNMLEFPFPDFKSWASLLGLLSPVEYFVTVDHSVLWQRHVSWAKPKGEDLRQYVTQRFSSNMVVCSLMMGAKLSVFFNSSVESTEMRRMLRADDYGNLKFWIGIIIALDCVVTLLALVATFTLWGMISSISDANTHALLRSSIGQYVICLPARFVVAALYLFMLWIMLFFIDFINGPIMILLTVVIMLLFFQVVIPISAFGRLIIHTGAMAKGRVLDEEFEKELLPSGLHASLLIRATDRRRRHTTDIQQYQKKASKRFNSDGESVLMEIQSLATNSGTNPPPKEQLNSANELQLQETARRVAGELDLEAPLLNQGESQSHRRTVSSDSTASDDLNFPRASFLNATTSRDLQEVVEQALNSRTFGSSTKDETDNEMNGFSSSRVTHQGIETTCPSIFVDSISPPSSTAFAESLTHDTLRHSETTATMQPTPLGVHSRRSMFPPSRSSKRQSSMRAARRQSELLGSLSTSRRVIEEWEEEDEVRNMYQLSSPAELLPNVVEESPERGRRGHRPRSRPRTRSSLLNKMAAFVSMTKVVQDEPFSESSSVEGDASIAENDKESKRRSAHNERSDISPPAVGGISRVDSSAGDGRDGETSLLLSGAESNRGYGNSSM
jgi:hypothetical protein